MRKSKLDQISDDDFIRFFYESKTAEEFHRLIGYEGRNINGKIRILIKEKCENLGLNISTRFRKNSGRKLSEIYSSRVTVKRKYIESLKKEDIRCAECHIGQKWNGKSLVLHLDHINGIKSDHHFENLRLLCPNCHSQTHTYSRPHKVRKNTDVC